MKKLFTLLLALVATTALWAEDFSVDGIYYNILTSYKVEVTFRGSDYDSYSNEYSGSVTIPSTVTYNGTTYSVTSIRYDAFRRCSSLTSVTIPNSVTSIGSSAFEDCSSITSITIPNSVTSIGDDAFMGCSSLTSVTIGNSVMSVGSYAFSWCSALTSVTIPNSVTGIGNSAFSYCASLTSVVIGNSVTSIGNRAFSDCSGLTSVTIGNSVTSIGDYAFSGCSGLTSVVWNAENYADFSSSSYAPFSNIRSLITSFTFGDSVKHVPAYLCYEMSNLTSITIPNSVTEIGYNAFYGCSGLKSIVWNAKNYADFSSSSDAPFSNISSKITSFTFGDSVQHIPAYLCYGMSKLTSITIPNSVTSIGQEAFGDCSSLTKTNYTGDVAAWCDIKFVNYTANPICFSNNFYINNQEIKDLVIPNTVDSIHNYAFYWCSGLTSVTIGNSVSCTGLTSVTIPNSVTSIGNEAFRGCSGLTSVTIGNSVTSIGDGAFEDCSGLREISLGSGLKTIGARVFIDCPRIYEVTCLAQEPPVAEQSSFTNYDAYFHAPCDAQRYYSVDPVWKNFHNVECIVTDETVMDDITITPSDCEATVVWLSHDQAATYSLVITKKGETYCTLTFNKYGQLINIALAPARVRAKQDAAEYTETGYSFTITGLEMGTTYDYTFAVLNDSQNIIDQHFGHFTTTQNSPTDLENTHSQSPMANSQKLLRDGQLIILRDGKSYSVMGQEL